MGQRIDRAVWNNYWQLTKLSTSMRVITWTGAMSIYWTLTSWNYQMEQKRKMYSTSNPGQLPQRIPGTMIMLISVRWISLGAMVKTMASQGQLGKDVTNHSLEQRCLVQRFQKRSWNEVAISRRRLTVWTNQCFVEVNVCCVLGTSLPFQIHLLKVHRWCHSLLFHGQFHCLAITSCTTVISRLLLL